jgi:peptidoglycan/xylan/chitin deacetylase (PgdA/CDA1 family)
MFIHRIPDFVTQVFPHLIWKMPVIGNDDRRVYLTFDDGPTPEITNFVLEELEKFHAKATFFCIGKNMEENPDLLQLINTKGHSLGNHTMNHVNAWKTSSLKYLENRQLCEDVFRDFGIDSVGFRPPYGRLTPSTSKNIGLSSNIFMWSILTGDYNSNLSPQSVLSQCLPKIKPGDIIVFHDSVKAFNQLKVLLPEFLFYLANNNFVPTAI